MSEYWLCKWRVFTGQLKASGWHKFGCDISHLKQSSREDSQAVKCASGWLDSHGPGHSQPTAFPPKVHRSPFKTSISPRSELILSNLPGFVWFLFSFFLVHEIIILFCSNSHWTGQERTEMGVLSGCLESLEATRGTFSRLWPKLNPDGLSLVETYSAMASQLFIHQDSHFPEWLCTAIFTHLIKSRNAYSVF